MDEWTVTLTQTIHTRPDDSDETIEALGALQSIYECPLRFLCESCRDRLAWLSQYIRDK
jgi:hypothetical protein